MKRWLSIAMILFICTAVFTAWLIASPNPGDENEYQELVNPSQGGGERTSTQYRQKVRKDMHISDRGERLHTLIESVQSSLAVTHGAREAALVEKMDNLTCIMQEKLEANPAPLQMIRFFEADRGIYHYASNRFEAEDASLFRYKISGRRLPENLLFFQPEMQGNAKSVFLTLGKEIHFTAREFQAELFDDKGSP